MRQNGRARRVIEARFCRVQTRTADKDLRFFLPARAVLVGILGDGDGIDAAEPAMQIDIGATAAAERTKFFHRGLPADRAGS